MVKDLYGRMYEQQILMKLFNKCFKTCDVIEQQKSTNIIKYLAEVSASNDLN